MSTGSGRTLARFAPWALAVLGAAAYASSFDGAFVFDDHENILDNASVRALWPPRWAASSRPVAMLSFALNYAVCGYRVGGWHAVNLAVHVATAVVLYDLIRTALSLPALAQRFSARSASIAFVSAAIWVVHPLHTSAVTYVVHRYESLAGLFYLATLAAFARGVGSPRARRWYALALAAGALGIATKESVVTLPVAVLFFDVCFVGEGLRGALAKRGPVHGALFALWIEVALLVMAGGRNESQGFGFAALTPIAYARSQLGAVVHYLRLVAWPHPLSIDYFDWPIASSLSAVAPQAALLGGVVAASLAALRRAPPLAFVGLAWLVLLAPTSSFLPLVGELVAERRMYVPLAFLVSGAVAAFDLATTRARKAHPVTTAVATAVVVTAAIGLLGVATFCRNRAFVTEEAIWSDVLATRPRNVRARYHLGLAQLARGDDELALTTFEEAARLDRGCWRCANNAGAILARRGRFDEAERYFASAVAAAPRDIESRANLVLALEKQGKWAEAIEQQRNVARLAPSSASFERLARRLASAPDVAARVPSEALMYAERAEAVARESGERPSLRRLATLGAAYAAAERWELAERHAQLLVTEATRAGREHAKRTGEAMLARFAAHEAWTEGAD